MVQVLRRKTWLRWVLALLYLGVITGIDAAHGHWDGAAATQLAQTDAAETALVAEKPLDLPDGVPMHVRDELAFIVRHIDDGNIATARDHWRKLLRAEARAGRGGNGEPYLKWIMSHAYRDELLAARKAVAMNRYYAAIETQLRAHEQEMRSLRNALRTGEVRVVRTVTHVPKYRENDPPPAHPVFAPRQLDRQALDQYLTQLQRQIAQLGHEDGLKNIDLVAAQTRQSDLQARIQELAGQLREDALVVSSSAR